MNFVHRSDRIKERRGREGLPWGSNRISLLLPAIFLWTTFFFLPSAESFLRSTTGETFHTAERGTWSTSTNFTKENTYPGNNFPLIYGYMGIKTNKKGTPIYFKYFTFEPFFILESIHNSHSYVCTTNQWLLQPVNIMCVQPANIMCEQPVSATHAPMWMWCDLPKQLQPVNAGSREQDPWTTTRYVCTVIIIM